MPQTITSTKLILVEGKDEVNFLNWFIRNIIPDATDSIQIMNYNGKNNFHSDFPALIDVRGFENVDTLAIFRDADTDAHAAFTSITGTLKQQHFPAPEKPEVFTPGNPRIGIYIMPGGSCSGMLESLCLQSQQHHPVMNCVEGFLQCVATRATEQPKNVDKAKCQAFLAVMPDIVSSVGLAADKGYWDFHHECFNALKSFLKEIITPSS